MPAIDSRGFTIDLIDQGNGETVVLVHSTGMAAGQWRAVTAQLCDRYRIVAPNLHGYGRSNPWPSGERLDISAEVNLLRAVISHCGGPVHLVGHSYGGLLSLAVARQVPADLATLTLIEPISIGVLRSEGESRALAEVDRMQRLFFAAFDRGDTASAMEHFVDYWYGEGAWRKIPEAQRLPIFARADKMYREIELIWNDEIPLEAYRSIGTSILVAAGECTTAAARRISEVISGGIETARFEEIPRGMHMSPVTQPDLVAGLISRHVERHPIS